MQINKECKICGDSGDNSLIRVEEMMFQTGEIFNYLKCSKCGCMSLLNLPKDASKYHSSHYYSLAYRQNEEEKFKKLKNIIRSSAMKAKLGSENLFDNIIGAIKKVSYSWINKDFVQLDFKILSVGCTNKSITEDMENYGFTDLTVLDPCSDGEIKSNSYKKYKSDIDSLNQNNYDLIMYHHSFEQIADPHNELQNIYKILKDEGTLLIRTSVCDSYAFRRYKQYWVHLDAPRNAFLYTTRGIRELAEKTGFYIVDIIYDSRIEQFTESECYRRGLPTCATRKIFDKEQLNTFDRKIKELNMVNDGDSACFYLKKNIDEG